MGGDQIERQIRQKLKVTQVKFQIQSRREGFKQPIESRVIIEMSGEALVGEVTHARLLLSDEVKPEPASYDSRSKEIFFNLHHSICPASQYLSEQAGKGELYVHFSDNSAGFTNATLSNFKDI